jgi:hypothetical protein
MRVFTRTTALAALICWLALSCWAYAAPGEMAALVADRAGGVTAQLEGASWRNAALMMTLPQGALVKVIEGGRATLSFVRGGTRVYLKGPCEVRVEERGVQVLSSKSPDRVRIVNPTARGTALVPGQVNLDRMGGRLMRPAMMPSVGLTTDPAVKTPRPTITWTTRGKLKDLELSIVQGGQTKPMYTAKLPGTARQHTLPTHKSLVHGSEYLLVLKGRTASGAQVLAKRSLAVLPREDVATVTAAEAEAARQYEADSTDISPLVVLLSIYTGYKLTTPAYDVTRIVVKERPDDARLYLLMGDYFQSRHEQEKAVQMFKKAESIGRP